MRDILEALRGYNAEQYAEALYNTLINYLIAKNIIDFNDYSKFAQEHTDKILKMIIDRDKEENKNKNSGGEKSNER